MSATTARRARPHADEQRRPTRLQSPLRVSNAPRRSRYASRSAGRLPPKTARERPYEAARAQRATATPDVRLA